MLFIAFHDSAFSAEQLPLWERQLGKDDRVAWRAVDSRLRFFAAGEEETLSRAAPALQSAGSSCAAHEYDLQTAALSSHLQALLGISLAAQHHPDSPVVYPKRAQKITQYATSIAQAPCYLLHPASIGNPRSHGPPLP